MPNNEALNFITTVRAWGYEIVSKADDNSGVTLRPVIQSAKKQGRSLEGGTDKGRQAGQNKDYKDKLKQQSTRRGSERAAKKISHDNPRPRIG